MRRITLPFIAGLLPLHVLPNTWTVGPTRAYTAPSQVSTLVSDGDTVNIDAGVYPDDVARWQANDLVLRGIGGMAHLESNGNAWGGKAIWVIQGNHATVEWMEFSECQVPDQNGAGIRLEGLGLTVRHCHFHHNQNGILCGEYHPSTMRIEHSEFGYNGHGDGYSHNLYIGAIDSLILRSTYSHHAVVGHELKSRAWVNLIEHNRFSNEADGTASREIDLPNGGQAYLIGNVVQQGAQGENSNLVGFGMEGLSNPGPHALYAVNNTLVNEKTNGTFFQAPAETFFKAYNNVLAGGGSFMSTWPATLDTLANLRSTSIAYIAFADAMNYDYRIDEGSPAHSMGYPAGLATSGYPLVALYEYVHPADATLRCQHALLDAGAFETCTTTGLPVHDGHEASAAFPNPAMDLIAVRARQPLSPRSLMVVDAQGRTVSAPVQHAQDRFLFDLHGLAPGFYRVRSDDGASWPFVKL
ncbi:MAG: hypothetical protein JNM62_14120 [Flavobacteriales bacterium]|nr:hypothetical protein [Flavobacteriales bacterium]